MSTLSPFPLTDRIFRWGIFFLLLFAPLAYGSVEPWSRAVVTISISLLGLVWILRELRYPEASDQYRRTHSYLRDRTAGLLLPALLFLALILLQVTPLPEFLLRILSPGSMKAFGFVGFEDGRTISVSSGSTRTALAQAAAMIFFFFLTLNTLRTRNDIRWIVRALLLTGFVIALFAIIQSIAIPRTIIWNPATRLPSPFGPFVSRSHFAGWMTLLVPLGLGYFLSIGHRRRGGEGGEHESGKVHRPQRDIVARRALAAFIIAVMSGALLLSLSRAGFLALLLAIAMMAMALSFLERGSRKIWLLLGTVSLSLLFALWIGGGPVAERLGKLAAVLEDPMGETRLALWRDTLAMTLDFPLFGSGLASYGKVFPLYQGFDSLSLFTHAENDGIQLLAEAGIAGLLVTLSGLLIYSKKIGKMLPIRKDREVRYLALGGAVGMAAFFAHSLTTFNFHIPSCALYLSLIAALTLKISFSKL